MAKCREWHISAPDRLLIESVDLSALHRKEAQPGSADLAGDKAELLLEVADLAFAWEGGEEVFTYLSLEVCKSRIVGLAAKSGGGKSTLGYILSGLAAPQRGEIRWRGEPIRSDELLNRVSYLFQFPERQFFCGTVYDEIAFGLRQLHPSDDETERRVESACVLVGLDFEQFRECSPFHLSGGEMRKVALASVIALGRSLVIFDEPTAELDSSAVAQLGDMIRRIRGEGITQIVISHDIDFLFSVCDDLILLSDGHVEFAGDVHRLFDSPEVLGRCGLQTPFIVEWSIESDMTDYVVSSNIRSMSELAKISKLTP